MKVIIIEDEALAARQLKAMVQDCDENIEVVTMLDSVEASVNWLRTHECPDLMLMDIELVDGQSFEIFNQVEVKSPVIPPHTVLARIIGVQFGAIVSVLSAKNSNVSKFPFKM